MSAPRMDTRTPFEYNRDMAKAINAEFDRLHWSSDTAPQGNTYLDAFPTGEEGIIVIEDTLSSTAFSSEGLLRALFALSAPIAYGDLWQAILPHRI